MPAQFPTRLLLGGLVLATLTVTGATAVSLPATPTRPPAVAVPTIEPPDAPTAPTAEPVPTPGPPVAAGTPADVVPPPRPIAPPEPEAVGPLPGLPVGMVERLRQACADGQLTGEFCDRL